MNIVEDRKMISNILVFVLIVVTNAITWSKKLPKKPQEFDSSSCRKSRPGDLSPCRRSYSIRVYPDSHHSLLSSKFCYVGHHQGVQPHGCSIQLIGPWTGNKTGCYIREVDDVIPFNESINALGYCYLIHCSFKQIDYVACGITSQDHDKCLITEAEINAPYPRCCPMVKCYDSNLPWVEHKNGTSRRDS